MSCSRIGERKKGGRKAWKFLVFWFPERKGNVGSVSVEKNARIPPDSRQEGALTKLIWPENGPDQKMYDVKVLRKGEDEAALYAVHVNAYTGAILAPCERAFTSAVLAQRKEMAAAKRVQNSLMKGTENNRREEEFSMSTIFQKKKCLGLSGLSETLSQPSEELTTTSLLNTACDPSPPIRENDEHCEISKPDAAPLVDEGFCAEFLVHHLDSVLAQHYSWEKVELIQDVEKSLQGVASNTREIRAIRSFFHCFRQQMEKMAKERVDAGLDKPRIVKLSPEYFVPDDATKTQLFPDIPFYVSKGKMAVLNTRSDSAPGWKNFTDFVLQEIYGEDLRWLSANGLRGTQGIHHMLRQGLQARARAEDPLFQPQQFTEHVNHLCANKKAVWRRKHMTLKTGLKRSRNKKSESAMKENGPPDGLVTVAPAEQEGQTGVTTSSNIFPEILPISSTENQNYSPEMFVVDNETERKAHSSNPVSSTAADVPDDNSSPSYLIEAALNSVAHPTSQGPLALQSSSLLCNNQGQNFHSSDSSSLNSDSYCVQSTAAQESCFQCNTSGKTFYPSSCDSAVPQVHLSSAPLLPTAAPASLPSFTVSGDILQKMLLDFLMKYPGIIASQQT